MMKSLSHLNEKDLTHHHPNKILINTVSEPSETEEQFQNVLKTFVIFPTAESQHNLRLFLEDGVPNIEEKFKRQTENHGPVKWYSVKFQKALSATENENCTIYFRSNCEISTRVCEPTYSSC